MTRCIQCLKTAALGMSGLPWNPQAKGKVVQSGFDALEKPSQFSLNFPKVFMALKVRLLLGRVLQMDIYISVFLCSNRQAHVFEKSNRGYMSDQLFLTHLHCFFSLCLLMEPESKKDTSSSSLKSSAFSVCLFPFLKGHLHNSEQPALLTVTKENFKQA